MATSRWGGAVVAHGPTELRRYLPLSLLATAIVAGLPLVVVFGFGRELGIVATLLSVALSFALSDLGSRAWKKWPGSRDLVFNDLMLWGYCRRVVIQRRLIRRVERLGFSTTNDPDSLTVAERTDLIKKLAVALEVGDPFTHGHSQRVARHAYLVAKTMNLPRRQVEKIRLAGVIHDVGKLRVPREIITKPGKLTDAEFDAIKQHTVDGAAMVDALRDPELTEMVRHHHERLDGSGYPDKAKAEDISMGARVLAVADTFDAVSSLRPYRAAEKHEVALGILTEEAEAGRLDAVVVDAFIRYYSGGRALKWWTFLSTGPAHLHDLSISFAQRLASAGLANAAIVGVTAVALAPGAPLHGLGMDRSENARNDRKVIVAENDRENPERRSSFGDNSPSSGSTAGSNGVSGTSDGRQRSQAPKERSRKNEERPEHSKDPGSASSGRNSHAKDRPRHGSTEDPRGQGEASVAETVEESTANLGAAATEHPTGKDHSDKSAVPELPVVGGPDK